MDFEQPHNQALDGHNWWGCAPGLALEASMAFDKSSSVDRHVVVLPLAHNVQPPSQVVIDAISEQVVCFC